VIIEINDTENVLELKSKFSEEIEENAESIRFFYSGKELINDIGLFAYEISKEILVIAMIKQQTTKEEQKDGE
jgi:hypothetical protein